MKESISKDEGDQAQIDIWNYVCGFTSMAVVKCAVDLGIPDVLVNPMTLSELSSALNCSPSALYRIMRFLIHRGIFKETVNDNKDQLESIIYAQTPLSKLLIKNGANSMVDLLLLETSPVMLAPWLSLSARALADDASSFQAANGEDLWRYAAENPAHSKLIDNAMGCMARITVPAILDHHPEVFEGITSLVDVGGGNGTALSILVKACPWIKGINFDLPHVVSAAPHYDGVEHVGGNMFESVPKADAVFIMQVLHDWNDEKCIDILKKCKEAIRADTGKMIIVDIVINEEEVDKYKHVHLYLDMVMMAHTDTGKERTPKEWEYVLNAAGFSRYTIKKFHYVQSVIEAYP
ncbi:(RS)-norcoclaurine 6-O-methyltransferase-like [Olea europaea subsp. europaea]|uniref:(RS)-norcoclaurine 6-O-methyltransferase-like n=1 Tax=Olea europaea subsp. europaea TaxID=158383 RepID=A0A8S0RKQ8_OLEEU|nr:(RS)-norcoclaurine 6-O-methyltransferase-like [Olea europaea subsp. europaea]